MHLQDLQLQDIFDRSFGRTAKNCADLLDWPGRMAPFFGEWINSQTGEETDWLDASKTVTLAKLLMYRNELVQANPKISHLKDTQIVFVMTSIGLTETLPQLEPSGGILIDALWLSFASFAVHSLFAVASQGDIEQVGDDSNRMMYHFALRASLYQKILQEKTVNRDLYQRIWTTWPGSSDRDVHMTSVVMWTNVGRFVVAHELSHLALHQLGDCDLEKVKARALIPESWDLSKLVSAQGKEKVDAYVFEVEADALALELCLRFHSSLESESDRRLTMASIYHLFLCLWELERSLGERCIFERRAYAIRSWIANHPLGDEALLTAVDQRFRRTRLFFDVASTIVPPD